MASPEEQQRLLDAEDGRYFAIDKFGTGLASIATEERIGGAGVAFGLPSAPALFLNLAYEAFAAYRGNDVIALFDQHPQGLWPDNQTPLFDFFEHFTAHVLFAYTALEALANEILPEGYTYEVVGSNTAEGTVYSRDEIERYVSLDEKLSKVLPHALDVSSPKGSHPWRDFKELKKVRNRLIHLKTSDRRATGPEIETIWGYMLRNSKRPFCDSAHALMAKFGPSVVERRWYKEYPYSAIT